MKFYSVVRNSLTCRREQTLGQLTAHSEAQQKIQSKRNLVDDDFLSDPIVLEVVVHVQNEDRKVVQVVKVQPEQTHVQ